jgi:plastocyanin domain-containing protein
MCLMALAACKELPPRAASGGPPVRKVTITAKGFEPARIEVAPGQPVTLRFTRKVDPSCGDAVDVQGDPVRHMLPLDTPIDVKLTAPASGEIAFACPMKMYRGAVVVVGH